jgi:chromosome segregation ATPase
MNFSRKAPLPSSRSQTPVAAPRPPLPRSNPNLRPSPALCSGSGDTKPAASTTTALKAQLPLCEAEAEYLALTATVNQLRHQVHHVAKENVALEQTMVDRRSADAAAIMAERESLTRAREALDLLVACEQSKVSTHRSDLVSVEATWLAQQERTAAAEAALQNVQAKMEEFQREASRAKRGREESQAEALGFEAEGRRCEHRMAALEYQRRKHEESLDSLKEAAAREVAAEEAAKKELAERLGVVADLDTKIKSLRTRPREN